MSKIQKASKKKRLKMWGEPSLVSDIGSLIIRYIKGEVKKLPWTEEII
jgi:methylenetetrahydrofolate reductase (NADPH)